MTLSRDQIISLTGGALSWAEKDGVLIPRRFTEKQLAGLAWSQSLSIRAAASSGIVLRARTDATALKMRFRVFPGSSKDLYAFDLTENGALTRHLEGAISACGTGELLFPLADGVKDVCLYFPPLAGTEILDVTFENAGVVEPAAPCGRKLLCLGDSITQGYTAHFPSLTQVSRLAAALDAEVVNQALGGDTFRAAIPDAAIPFTPDTLLIAYGCNDWSKKSRGDICADAEAFFEALGAAFPAARAYVLTPIHRDDEMRPAPSGFTFDEWRRKIADIAARYPRAHVVRGETLLPAVRELYDDFRIHPGDLGFSVYAERLIREILSFEGAK